GGWPMRKFGNRTSPRWQHHDYALPGAYFVTAVTRNRSPLLGSLRGDECALSSAGLFVRDVWRSIPQRFAGVELDAFVVMPDHVHALLMIHERPESAMRSLSAIVQWAKSRSAHHINVSNGTLGKPVWQASFHDRVARTIAERDRIRRYIEDNPRRACQARPTSPRP
ncbi:MAG TPA: transposase, partial [Candidatus Elarobacter sp.]|nr:transposase [Candidatus Elarobacter sp.]